MTMGFYLSAIIGTFVSFLVGCMWYTFIFGKTWQKEMDFSDEKVKEIFTPKKMLAAFISEWIASFCTVGIFLNLQVDMVYKILMLSTVIIFQGIKLSIFDGKTIKTILINEGYRVISIIIIGLCFKLFI